MSLKDLVSQNLLLRWLTGRGHPPDLALSMAGVRLGERVVQVGLGDASLFVALGSKVGYTGRVCGVDEDADVVTRAQRAADRHGVLVEAQQCAPSRIPLEAHDFDVAVLLAHRTSLVPAPPVLSEAFRLLRPGGRCLVIVGADAARLATPELVPHLRDAGFKASRELAVRDGLAFYEAMKSA